MWQCSNERIRLLRTCRAFRRVPTSEDAQNLDNVLCLNKHGQPQLGIDSSSAFLHLAGPIGVYYIHATDMHPVYKQAFSDLIWCLYKLRRRFVTLDMLKASGRKATYVTYLRESLVRLEYLLPNHWNTINVHLLQHLCESLKFKGPPHGTWNFGFERWIQIAKGVLKSGKSPTIGLMRAMVEYEWTTFFSYQTPNDLDELLTPPLNANPFVTVRLLGNGRPIALTDTPLYPNTPKRYGEWRLVYDFILNEDPLFSIIGDEYRATHRNWKQTGMIVESWTPNADSLMTMQQTILATLKINITHAEIMQLLVGADRNAMEYDRIQLNQTEFVTSSHQQAKGRRSRNVCFFSNQQQQDEYVNSTSRQDKINYPIGVIDRILLVKSTSILRFQTIYKVFRIQNYEYLTKEPPHPSSLPHVKPIPRHLTVQVQPIIDVMSVKPYNVALWPALATTSNGKFLAVWIDPQHGDT